MKRKIDSNNEQEGPGKRPRLADDSGSNLEPESNDVEPEVETTANEGIASKNKITEEHKDGPKAQDQGKGRQRARINKLVPPRPFPTVPASVSATGPRSSHKEGKNLICITRKTSLGRYLRRCKDVIIEDG